jgi:hypothetical protein
MCPELAESNRCLWINIEDHAEFLMIKPVRFISALTLTSGITFLACNKVSAQQCAGDPYGNSLYPGSIQEEYVMLID